MREWGSSKSPWRTSIPRERKASKRLLFGSEDVWRQHERAETDIQRETYTDDQVLGIDEFVFEDGVQDAATELASRASHSKRHFL